MNQQNGHLSSLARMGSRMGRSSASVMALVLAGSAASGLISGCYDGANERARIAELEGQLTESERQRRELDEQLAALRSENDALAARLTELGENVEALRSRSAALEGDLTAAERERDELRERERQANERLATFRAMLERFRSMIDSGRLRVSIVRNRMVVELPDNVLFDSGQAELKPEGQATLTEIAGVLSSIEGRVFQIAGHTDNVPIRSRRFPSNWELSTTRAVVVARFLIETGHMTSDRISAAGYADTVPIESNDTEEGRARNRRIEIVLMPNLDELPDLSSLMSTSASGS
jgi:chemotaxis protein MotB